MREKSEHKPFFCLSNEIQQGKYYKTQKRKRKEIRECREINVFVREKKIHLHND